MVRAGGLRAGVCVCAAALAGSFGLADRAEGEWLVPQAALEMPLFWADLCGTPADLLEAAAGHLQELVRPAAVRVSSRVSTAGSGRPVEGVTVALMCSPPGPRGLVHTVGGSAGRKGARQPAVWVRPAVVAGGLGLDLGRNPRWTERDRAEFSRALAVVVLHELVHTLVGVEHRPTGLFSATLRRNDLLDPRLTIDPDLLPAFRAAVAGLETAEGPPGAREGTRARMAHATW